MSRPRPARVQSTVELDPRCNPRYTGYLLVAHRTDFDPNAIRGV